MAVGKIVLPDLHNGGQYQVFHHPARFKIMVCGRRWGKSLLAAVMLITTALRGGIGWWVWPSFPMAMVGWRRLMGILAPLVAAKVVTVNRQERLIIFPGGGSIQMKSAERPNSLRGEGLDLVVIDEWAYIRYGDRIWESDLRPALAEKMGKALLITTPRGMDHVYEYFHRAKKDDQYTAWHFPTWTNPFIPKLEIELARKSMRPSIFNQEYGAEFLEGAAIFFSDIGRVMRATWQEGPIDGHEYCGGLDIGRWRDRSVFSIMDLSLDTKEVCFMEVYTELPFSVQKSRVLTTAARFDIDILNADVTGMGIGLGEQIAEEAEFVVEATVYSNKSKNDMFNSLHAEFENDKLLIPDLDWLKVEYQMIMPEIVPGRLTVKLNAREGFTDDGVNSNGLVSVSGQASRISIY